jgi:polygalacturonase
MKRFLRPVLVSLVGCKKVLLQGVVFQNSPAWNLHPLMCEDLVIDHVLVMNPSYSQNGDALDLESCRRVLILDSRFNAGDDGICLKSGKNEDGPVSRWWSTAVRSSMVMAVLSWDRK